MPVSAPVLDAGHPKGHQVQSLVSGALVWGGRRRGHRQLRGNEGHVKEWRKRTGDHEKGELGWGGVRRHLEKRSLPVSGQEEGHEGRLWGHKQAWRCVSESLSKVARIGCEGKGLINER